MNTEESVTLQNIHKAALQEFLDKGYRDASLRNIVRAAGVTTGAFYGYYSNKAALFTALVEPHAAAVMGMFMRTQTDFAALPDAEQPDHMGIDSGACLDEMIDYIYEHFDTFKLVICCSEGTAYADFIHEMVEVEVEYTFRYIDVLRRLGKTVPDIDRQLAHILTSAMFEGIFEIVRHDMPKERARQYVATLREFNVAGWQKIMGQ